MKRHLKPILAAVLCLCLVWGVILPIRAEANPEKAKDISGKSLVTEYSGLQALDYLFDGKISDGWKTEEAAHLSLQHEGGIGSLYLSFGKVYGLYSIINNDTGDVFTAGEHGFVHEFIDLQEIFGEAPKSVTIALENGVARLNEITVFSPGQVPETVQQWELPVDGKTDLVLFSTHSDDDQLFFAGLLPYYAVEKEYQVQVVYLTDHHNSAKFRIHEMLNGLWAVGIRTYPIFGPYEDFGDTYSMEGCFRKFEKLGWSREQMTGFVVEQLRRFQPMVAIGHDPNGEYGHAQHKVYSQLLMDAVAISADTEKYPETAEKYGVWDVPKTYLHMYKENPIVMDWDQPMENFGGLTPYEVTRDLGFEEHGSQHGGWSWYFSGADTAAEIEHYSPCDYGLYRSTVGEDVNKNDFFENLISHAEQDRLAEEARLEAERLEAERLEAERLKAEEDARKASEEAARKEAEAASIAASIAAEEASRQTELPQHPAETKPADQSTSSSPLLIPMILFLITLITAIGLSFWLVAVLKGMKKSRKQ
jgi:LmbE family N-acetylglucosaminyl deacetylase